MGIADQLDGLRLGSIFDDLDEGDDNPFDSSYSAAGSGNAKYATKDDAQH
jgi:hypothetical protein